MKFLVRHLHNDVKVLLDYLPASPEDVTKASRAKVFSYCMVFCVACVPAILILALCAVRPSLWKVIHE